MGAENEHFKERVEEAEGIVAHPLSESPWNRDHFSMKQWGSEKHKSRASRAMLPRTALCWEERASGGACGWAVVQLDYDEEMGPLHRMYGLMEAEFEVQRTTKRAELTAFFCSRE